MKIFVVCNSLGAGGAERVGVNLANGFANHGHDVYIITDIFQDAAYPVDEKVKVLPMITEKCGKMKKYVRIIQGIRKYAKRYQPNVVIGMMHLPSLLARISLLNMGIPVVLTIHNALQTVPSYNPGWITKLSDRYLSKIYRKVTVLSLVDKALLGENDDRIVVMPNPLTFKAIKVLPKKEKVIFSAGRLDAWNYKGWDLLIKAWGLIAHKFPDWKIELAGNGSAETKCFLEKMMKTYHVENQLFLLGYQKDMLPLYQKASVFLLSSRSEGLPMVLIEAMSQGCAPVACSNLGRTKEIIISEKEGLIYETENVEAMAKALEKVISDSDLRAQMQMAAIERSKFYSIDNIVNSWQGLFDSLKI